MQEVDKAWKILMELVNQNSNALTVIGSSDMLNTLLKCKETVLRIRTGLDKYIDKKLLIFPRLV